MNSNVTVTPMASTVAPKLQGRQRINSIDMMRGLVMLIMLLDHVRERDRKSVV